MPNETVDKTNAVSQGATNATDDQLKAQLETDLAALNRICALGADLLAKVTTLNGSMVQDYAAAVMARNDTLMTLRLLAKDGQDQEWAALLAEMRQLQETIARRVAPEPVADKPPCPSCGVEPGQGHRLGCAQAKCIRCGQSHWEQQKQGLDVDHDFEPPIWPG